MANTLKIFESDLRPWQYWRVRAEDLINERRNGKPSGRSTGFRALDKLIRLKDTELIVIAARPSMGKTALGMQMAELVARSLVDDNEPGCVAIFSAEMGGGQLYLRMASALCGVSTHKLDSGDCTPLDFDSLHSAVQRLRDLPIWMDDNSGPTTAQMLEQLATLEAEIPVRMMLFDFMELGGDRAQKEDIRISRIAHNLKGIAKTLNIPVVAISQINRSVENRPTKMPALSDLRYSGMIEQLADVVLFLMRPEYYAERGQSIDVPSEDLSGVAYVQVAKNRNGPVGLTKMAFVKDRIMFADLERVPLNGA